MAEIALSGRLTICDGKALAQFAALPAQVKAEQWRQLTLDLSGLNAADSLVFASIFQLQRQLRPLNCQLTIRGMSAQLQTLAQAYGIDDLMKE